MKRVVSIVMLVAMLLSLISVPLTLNAETNGSPVRIINLVYDDSGSMINTDNVNVDTWCQAKYAMEVFAAMLGDNDRLNIYYMSDFEKSSSADPKLKLAGIEGPETNVNKVHGMVTRAGNTPFNAVRKANSDLESASADEKWLVVLTDGEFQGIENADDFFSKKSEDVNVMFLGMGEKAEGITANESKNIYYEKAQKNSEILSKITGICTRVFNSNRLEINPDSKKFSFDVPMKQLIVFAQGAKVAIKGIRDSEGNLIQSTEKPVSVRYSEVAATNYTDFIINKNLVGSIATFDGSFDAGNYSVDVSGAETIEVYYKPDIEIAAYLKDKNGKEVTDLSELEAGEYVIEFSFVKSGTEEKVGKSKLLGDVAFEAYIKNNGKLLEGTYNSGDTVVLEEGDIAIDVTGRYLDYNSVSTHREYSIYKDKKISFEVDENRIFEITKDGIDNKEPLKVRAYIDGKDFTDEQWKNMGLPEIKLSDTGGSGMGKFRIEKSDEAGVYDVYPSLASEKPGGFTYKSSDMTISYAGKNGNETWKGSSKAKLKLNDTRSWIARNRNIIIKLFLLVILLVLALGYMPFIKHYLPKKLKKKPLIEMIPNIPGMEASSGSGKYEKEILYTIMPYASERGTIRFLPKQARANCPKTLNVIGSTGKRMGITNIKAFAGKEFVTFNGEHIEKDYPGRIYHTGAGVMIEVNAGDWKYSCQPNQQLYQEHESKGVKKKGKKGKKRK